MEAEGSAPEGEVDPQAVVPVDEEAAGKLEADAYFQGKKKHYFMVSDAGRPIFSRYGDASDLSDFMGVIVAIAAFARHQRGDDLRYIVAGDHVFVFTVKGSIIMVCVASTGESPRYLQMQLDYLYLTIVSNLTEAAITHGFNSRGGFDLGRVMAGTEKHMHGMISLLGSDMSFLLDGFQCLRLPPKKRAEVAQVLREARPSSLTFAMLMSRNKMVSIVRPQEHVLPPADLLVLMNYINSSESFRNSETWAPVCLPTFNPNGHFHAYVCYIRPELCLVLLTTKQSEFYSLAECRQQVEKALVSRDILNNLAHRVEREFDWAVAECQIPDLYHFVYFSVKEQQYTMPRFDTPYVSKVSHQRLFRLYQHIHSHIHRPGNSMLRQYFYQSQSEVIFTMVTKEYELHAAFSPLVTKRLAFDAFSRLRRWIVKEHDSLIMTKSPLW